MAPSPHNNGILEDISEKGSKLERVVISGMSGLYPDCKSVKDLADVLYNKKNPINSENQRWSYSHPEVVQSTGKISDLNVFDAQFFKVNFRLANTMDPMARKILEQSYQAIYDAGISPGQLSGKKVGVYIGASFSETEKTFYYDSKNRTGFGITGCSKTMYANRISYWLNAKGPSMSMDVACCSSTAAIEQAYLDISRGECEAAIVGGTNLCLHPHSLIHHGRLTKSCMDGKTKSFDQNADGCAKSEAINVLFIQRAKDALRIYAEIVHVKTEFRTLEREKTGPRFGFYRNPNDMTDFLKHFYNDAKVSPKAVEYVEAFGSGVPEADKSELEAIDNIFCKNREQPLSIGSVMSNIGYSEGCTGISAITKVLLGYETGQLAGNLHYSTPRKDISGIREGRIRVLSDNIPFNRQYTAVNGVSFTGLNSHVLLKGHYKPKDINRYNSKIPYLVTISGRQDSAVNSIFTELKQRPIDPEELALLHNIHGTNITGHVGRGFVILDKNEDQKTVCIKESVGYFDNVQSPLWFVYSGMGSQWPTMGSQLMRIPIFAASIQRCQKVLEPKRIDLLNILTSSEKSIFDNVMHSFVGIAAVQIGLTDILNALDIKPDKIIGHSAGELGCAYADGCLTVEETMLSAYYRGLVFIQTSFIRGSMVAVGMGYKQISSICPSSIEVACHNSSESCTISGPEEDMREFFDKLVAKGIFAKEVPCSNTAYHSRYIADAGPILLKFLKEVIKTPKMRSERWVSTSVPQDKWNESAAKYSSAEYYTNNLLSPVFFEEASNLIPSNAVVVEIAPHGLLQAILKRSLHPDCHNIPLTRRGHPDNVLCLLEAIGKLYMNGFTPKMQELYPKVQFPVSTGTPMLSHLVEWAHTETWSLSLYMSAERKTASSCTFVVSINDDENMGNQIKGKIQYPFAAALVAVWDTLAMINQLPRRQVSVVFHDIVFYCQPVLHDQRQLRLHVNIHRGSGRFEVNDGLTKVIAGFVKNPKVIDKSAYISTGVNDIDVTADELYDLLSIREYSYNGDFRSILGGNASFNSFSMHWNENWVTLIDGLIQINALRQKHDGVSQPLRIRHLSIDINKYMNYVQMVNDKKVVPAVIYDLQETTKCGGVLIQGIQFRHLPLFNEMDISLKYLKSRQRGEIKSHTYSPLLEGRNYKLQTSMIGDITTLKWVQDSNHIPDSGIEVKVHYAGLNRLDASKAMGEITVATEANFVKNHFGYDFSGVTKRGDRVMGISIDGSCKSVVNARPDLLWPIPDHWSFEDAATVPMAYMTALYCFNFTYGSMRNYNKGKSCMKSESILVQGGAGALGQALISIGLALGYEIFTTVSDSRKKRSLMKLFPELKEQYIGHSRDSSFSDMVLQATKGKGCMIVFNCLKGELRNASLKCSSWWILDVSMPNPQDSSFFDMSHLNGDHSYTSVNILQLLTMGNKSEIETLRKALTEGISQGYVRPLSRTIFSPHEVSRVFQLFASSQHRGRILLKLDENIPFTELRIQCKPESSYVLFCGQSTIHGVQLVELLISRGARKIFLHYKHSPGYINFKSEIWRDQGVQVEISCDKISSYGKIVNVLNNAALLGNVDGIIVDTTESDDDETRSVVQNLDLASVKLFQSLRCFTIITDNLSIQKEYLCKERQNNGLPFTMVDVGFLKKDQYASCFSKNYLYTKAVEAAICCDGMSMIAEPIAHTHQSLLEKLCDIANLKIPEIWKAATTLGELGVVTKTVPIISNYLRDYCNIELIENDVSSLTLERIKEIEDAIIAPGYTDKKGLETFYSYVDPDEMLATTETVFMTTLTTSATMRDDEFDVREKSLCIIPGLEGHHGRFKVLCERLKLPAFALQPGLDYFDESIQQTAQRYANFLLQRSAIQNNFYILGFETGIFIALELTRILEKNGLTGTVFLLGGAPEDISNEIEKQLQAIKTAEELQDAVAKHMFNIMVGDDQMNNVSQDLLAKCSSWKEKIDIIVRTLLGKVPHSAQYARAQIEASLARLVQARRYSGPAAPLRSRLVLLRSPLSARSDHTRLHRLSLQPLIQHDILAPLPHAPDDLRCATIINKYLDNEIIEKFERKNLCDTYLLNSSKFMSLTEA